MKSVKPILLVLVLFLAFGPLTIQAQTAKELSFVEKMIAKAQPKMVKIFGAGVGKVEGFATGFLVSGDGKIITTQGVILDGRRIRVVLADGASHEAIVLKRDREKQVGILKIQAETPDFFEVSAEPVGEKGDWIVALCNAFKVADKEEPLSATLGIISLRTEMDAKLTKRDYAYRGAMILIDAITSNPGAAGGAVLNAEGELVGMVGKVINSSETNTRLNYAVPCDELRKILEGKKDSVAAVADKPEPTEKADLGIVLFKFGGRSNPAYIDRIVRGSPAATAKLKTDDMIIAIGGQKIGSVKEYNNMVETLRPNEEVLVIVKRGLEIVRAHVTPRVKK